MLLTLPGKLTSVKRNIVCPNQFLVERTVNGHMPSCFVGEFQIKLTFVFSSTQIEQHEYEFVAENASGFHPNRILEFFLPEARKENI